MVELASKANCGNREYTRVVLGPYAQRKISEELLAETLTPKEAFDYAIRQYKLIEHNRTIKSRSHIHSKSSGKINIKQEPVGILKQPRKRQPQGGGRRRGDTPNFQQNQNQQGQQNLI